jgi:hypothetical protein
MQEIDEAMKKTFIQNLETYLATIRGMEQNSFDVCEGILVLEKLMDVLISDLSILDRTAHDEFRMKKAELGRLNKAAKTNEKARFEQSDDPIDQRNVAIHIIRNFDLKKHAKLGELLKGIAHESNLLGD